LLFVASYVLLLLIICLYIYLCLLHFIRCVLFYCIVGYWLLFMYCYCWLCIAIYIYCYCSVFSC